VKRLFRKYKKTRQLSEKLILNHIILLHNVFGEQLVPLIFYKIEEEHWPQVKTFLVFLNYLPDNYVINKYINETDVPLDEYIVQKLRKI